MVRILVDELAKAIHIKRWETGLTTRQLAEQLGFTSSTTISRIENGHIPKLMTYAKLCCWLEVSLDKFIREEIE